MDVKTTEMKSVSMAKLGPNFISLYSFLDEDTWPDWLWITIAIAFLMFVGISLIMALSIRW